MEIIYIIITLTTIITPIILIYKFLKYLLTSPINTPNLPTKTNQNMNEGDYHSGPEGYQPNTAYPDTHYGNIYNTEEDENH